MLWRRGVWTVAGTSAGVDWQLTVAAIAAAAGERVAVLAIGATEEPAELVLGQVATWQTVRDGGAGSLAAAEVGRLVLTLRETHGLVLVAAGAGLLVPLGAAGWTLADLALSLSAPAVVVTDAGPDAINHTTLALAALSAHGVTAAVVTVGEPAGLDALPVTPAGRIPADAAERPEEFAAAAPAWLDQILQAGVRENPTAEPISEPGAAIPARTVGGRRVVAMLLAVFAAAILLACGMAFINRPSPVTRGSVTISVSAAGTRRMVPGTGPGRMASLPAPPAIDRTTHPAADVCPQWTAGVVPSRADPTTQARVDAAWTRIEAWLAAHATKSRRSLRAPAATASIDQLQRRMSVAFPADLVASLRRHNGAAAADGFTLPPFYRPSSLTEIASHWSVNCQALADLGNLSTDWWSRAFVPYAAAGDGGSLLADQRDGGHGRVGEFYPENGTDFQDWPPSLTELLEQTAQCLESGRPYAGHYQPEVHDGALRWKIV